MKQTISFLFLFLALTAGCGQAGPDSPAVEMAILYDQTDKMLLRPDAKQVLGLFDFANHPDRAAALYAAAITDRKLNEEYMIQLPDAAYTEAHNEADDITYRGACIKAFSASVDSVLSRLTDSTRTATSLGNTECMNSIARALRKLSSSTAAEKALYVYSDLMENGAISLYHAGARLQLQDTAAIAEGLLKVASLPDRLDGISVCLLYRPASREADLQYSVISAAYSHLLSSRGAIVTISASNDFKAL